MPNTNKDNNLSAAPTAAQQPLPDDIHRVLDAVDGLEVALNDPKVSDYGLRLYAKRVVSALAAAEVSRP